MLTFACIAGGLIVASTVFALLGPSGSVVTLSDIAREMETTHRLQPGHPRQSMRANRRDARFPRRG
jgi:hypothetical protein